MTVKNMNILGNLWTVFWHLVPYRTEWMIYHEELRFAGSIDMVFESSFGDGSLVIYDWKRCKSIDKTSSWNKFATREEISHFPDTNYWHYCLQLNTYAMILEEKYDKIVSEMYLVCLHPDKIRIRVFRVSGFQIFDMK